MCFSRGRWNSASSGQNISHYLLIKFRFLREASHVHRAEKIFNFTMGMHVGLVLSMYTTNYTFEDTQFKRDRESSAYFIFRMKPRLGMHCTASGLTGAEKAINLYPSSMVTICETQIYMACRPPIFLP